MLTGTEILTTAQMRAIESAAMDSGQATGLELMERAGAAVVDAILARWPDLKRAVVLCGPGNNGGDGFVVARLLKQHGTAVTTLFTGSRERLSPDAGANHDRWQQMLGEDDRWLPDADDGDEDLELEIMRCGVVVDALLGTGGSRPLSRKWARHLTDAADCGTPIVAVDALSGLDLDTGRYMTEAGDQRRATAALTVTFQRPKIGHKLEDGPVCSGEISVADIGLEFHLRRFFEGPFSRHDPVPAYRLAAPQPALAKSSGHKYDHGHALVLAGPSGRGGAARLAARAALRTGAGMVTLACPQDSITENAAALPDAIMVRALDTPDDLRKLLADRRINAICAGPGLGVERAAQLLPVLAEHATDPHPFMWIGNHTLKYDLPVRSGRGTVLDADALTAGARQRQVFLAGLHVDTVLTPHDGEFSRLFPDLGARLKQREAGLSRLDAAREAASRAMAVILLKGPTTVISANAPRLRGRPPVEGWINAAAGADAVPWLATAGAGDVLAGIITGLMARGLPSYDAAATGAWLHAAAARRFGPGLIADDLPDEIPGVYRDLGL